MFRKLFAIIGWWTFGGTAVLFALTVIAVPYPGSLAGLWFVRGWRGVSALVLLLHLVVLLVRQLQSRHKM